MRAEVDVLYRLGDEEQSQQVNPLVEQFAGGVPGMMVERELRTLLESWPGDADILGCLDKLALTR